MKQTANMVNIINAYDNCYNFLYVTFFIYIFIIYLTIDCQKICIVNKDIPKHII